MCRKIIAKFVTYFSTKPNFVKKICNENQFSSQKSTMNIFFIDKSVIKNLLVPKSMTKNIFIAKFAMKKTFYRKILISWRHHSGHYGQVVVLTTSRPWGSPHLGRGAHHI